MPVINGTPVRARYTSLKLNELSSVDFPAQSGARAVIMKRDSTQSPVAKSSWLAREFAKYVGSDDGAHTFQEVIAENNYDEEIWPLVSALQQSISSIMGDAALSSADREKQVTQSVDQFLVEVRAINPPTEGGDSAIETVEKQLKELISKGNDTMPKSLEDLQAEVSTLKGQVTTLETEKTSATERAVKAEGELATEKTAHAETKKSLVAATDATLKIGDREIRKSVVGEDNFAVFKAQQEDGQMVRLEKRADAEMPHLPGTATEKAAVLKHVDAMPDEAKKTFMTIITAAEKMASGAFKNIGYVPDGGDNGDVAKAQATFKGKVAEIEKRDNCSKSDAMSRARTEFPTEFAEAYPQGAGA